MVSQRVWGRETNTVCLCSLRSLGWAWQLWGRQKFCGLPRVLFVCFFFFFVCFVFTLLLLPLLLLLLFLLWFMRWKCVNFLALIFTFVVGFMPVHFSLLRYLGAAFFGSAARYAYAAYDKSSHITWRPLAAAYISNWFTAPCSRPLSHPHSNIPLLRKSLLTPFSPPLAALEPQQFKLNNKMGAKNRCGFLSLSHHQTFCLLYVALCPFLPLSFSACSCFCRLQPPIHRAAARTRSAVNHSIWQAAFTEVGKRRCSGRGWECLSLTSHANLMISTRKNLVVSSHQQLTSWGRISGIRSMESSRHSMIL